MWLFFKWYFIDIERCGYLSNYSELATTTTFLIKHNYSIQTNGALPFTTSGKSTRDVYGKFIILFWRRCEHYPLEVQPPSKVNFLQAHSVNWLTETLFIFRPFLRFTFCIVIFHFVVFGYNIQQIFGKHPGNRKRINQETFSLHEIILK